jgi:hypothetical protein
VGGKTGVREKGSTPPLAGGKRGARERPPLALLQDLDHEGGPATVVGDVLVADVDRAALLHGLKHLLGPERLEVRARPFVRKAARARVVEIGDPEVSALVVALCAK